MPPTSKATILFRAADALSIYAHRLARKEATWGQVALSVRIQHEVLTEIRAWAEFTSANSYVGQRSMRIHLFNTSLSLKQYEAALSTVISALQANPTDTPAIIQLAVIAGAMKSVKLAPHIKELDTEHDETLAEVGEDE